MNKSLLAVLNDAERLLVGQTGRAELAALDEDAAIELEARVRRARNKYVGQYRRAAAAAVAEHGGRGKARPENTRAAMKAEAFEEALARVSGRAATPARPAARHARRSGWRRPGPPGRANLPVRKQPHRPLGAKARRPPENPPVTVRCARPPWRNAGPAPAPRVTAGRPSGTADEPRGGQKALWKRPPGGSGAGSTGTAAQAG